MSEFLKLLISRSSKNNNEYETLKAKDMRYNSFLKRIDEIRANSVTPKEFKKVWGTSLEEYKAKMADYLENQLGLYDEENKVNNHPAEVSLQSSAVGTAEVDAGRVNADQDDKDDNSDNSGNDHSTIICKHIEEELSKPHLKKNYPYTWDFEHMDVKYVLLDFGTCVSDFISKKREKMLEDAIVTFWKKKSRDLICSDTDNRIEPKEVSLKKKIWDVTFSVVGDDENLESSERVKDLKSKEVATIRIIDMPGLGGEDNDGKVLSCHLHNHGVVMNLHDKEGYGGKFKVRGKQSSNKNDSISWDFKLMALNTENEKKPAEGIKLQINPTVEEKYFCRRATSSICQVSSVKDVIFRADTTRLPNLIQEPFSEADLLLVYLKGFDKKDSKVKVRGKQPFNKNDSISWNFMLMALNRESEKKLAEVIKFILKNLGDSTAYKSIMAKKTIKSIKLRINPASVGHTIAVQSGNKFFPVTTELSKPYQSPFLEPKTLLVDIGILSHENILGSISEKSSKTN